MKIVLNYDSACDFCEGMASVCRDGKWGFIDTSGREVVPCKYDCVDDFHEGMARVNIGGRWNLYRPERMSLCGGKTGFVDKTGREVILCQYLHAENFHDGFADVFVEKDGKGDYFLIDKSGQRADSGRFFVDVVFSEGLSKSYYDDHDDLKIGFMDKTGSDVIPCIYDDAGDFHEGLARVARNKKWGFVDKTGREVVPCQYVWANDFHDGLACVNVGEKEYGFIDKTGRVVIRDVHPYTVFSEGLAQVSYGNKSGYIDKTGQVAIPARFDRAYDFHDDLAMVKENRTWGFIDKTGQMVIEYKTEPAPEPPKFPVSDEELPF